MAQHAAVSLRAGTLGGGIEVGTAVLPKLNVRAGASYLPFSYDDAFTVESGSQSVDLNLETDLKMPSLSLLADYHPFGGTFRLSTGLVYNATTIEGMGFPDENSSLDTGVRKFSGTTIGTLSATIEYANRLQPYAGLGFGNAVAPGKRLGFLFDLGVLYTGGMTVELDATEMIRPTAKDSQVAENNHRELNDALGGLTLYPVVSLGLSYQF